MNKESTQKQQTAERRMGDWMGCMEEIIDNEFSTEVIGVMNFRLDDISTLVAENVDADAYGKIDAKLSNLLVDISKAFFTQGFLRGVAAAKGGAV